LGIREWVCEGFGALISIREIEGFVDATDEQLSGVGNVQIAFETDDGTLCVGYTGCQPCGQTHMRTRKINKQRALDQDFREYATSQDRTISFALHHPVKPSLDFPNPRNSQLSHIHK